MMIREDSMPPIDNQQKLFIIAGMSNLINNTSAYFDWLRRMADIDTSKADDVAGNPVAFCGIHRLGNGKAVFITSAHLPREGDPPPVKFSDGTVYKSSRAEAERIAMLANHLKVIGMDGESAEIVSRDADGTQFVRMSLRLSHETLAILDALDFAARRANAIVWVSMPIISAIREMGMQGRFSRIAAMISTPETRRSAPADKVICADYWSVP